MRGVDGRHEARQCSEIELNERWHWARVMSRTARTILYDKLTVTVTRLEANKSKIDSRVYVILSRSHLFSNSFEYFILILAAILSIGLNKIG